MAEPYRTIPLTKGKVTLVDTTDYEWLSLFKWHYSNGYAVRRIYINKRRDGISRMHREILNAPSEKQVDHINGDGLDNRRSNLRLCTRQENARNSAPRGLFKGVEHTTEDRWCAYIKINGRKKHIGVFADQHTAALAYDHFARRYFGEFARPNFDYDPAQDIIISQILTTYPKKTRLPVSGVRFLTRLQKWAVRLVIHGRRVQIGVFCSEIEALEARRRILESLD